jgi:hypothetical protein
MASHWNMDQDMIFCQGTIVAVRVAILHRNNLLVLQTWIDHVNKLIKVSTKLGGAGIAKDILPTYTPCAVGVEVGVGALHTEEGVSLWAKEAYQYFRIHTMKQLPQEGDISICHDSEDPHHTAS